MHFETLRPFSRLPLAHKIAKQFQILILQTLTHPFCRKIGNMPLSSLDLSEGCEIEPILRSQKQPARLLALNLVGKLQNVEGLEDFAVLHIHKHHICMIRIGEDESPAYL